MSGEPGEGYKDRQITCKDCRTEFAFTAREQAYYVEMGYPLTTCVRCKSCKEQKQQKSVKR